jgi:hypothetical protein
MDNNSELNNQIISQEDKKIIERLSKERGLSSVKLFHMIEEELSHQGMARRVGIISKLHNLIRQNNK